MRYLRNAIDVLDGIVAEELDSIRSAADLCATAIGGGGLVHVFGTGHSHILAEELFYRAGGLAAVNPILVDRLMLHLSAIDSTRLERLAAMGEDVLAGLAWSPGDAMIVASNSGGNAVCDVVAVGAKRAGVGVIAVVSRAHAASVTRGAAGSAGLLDVADVVIDNRVQSAMPRSSSMASIMRLAPRRPWPVRQSSTRSLRRRPSCSLAAASRRMCSPAAMSSAATSTTRPCSHRSASE